MASIGVFTPHVERVDGGEQGNGDVIMSKRRIAVVTAASGMLLAAACVAWLASPDGGLGGGVKPTTLYESPVMAPVYSSIAMPVQGTITRPAGWSDARLRFEVARLMQEERLTAEAQGELTDAVDHIATTLTTLKQAGGVAGAAGPPGPPGPPGAPGYAAPEAAPAYEETPAAPVYETPAAPVYETPASTMPDTTPAAPVYETPAAPVYETPAAPVYETPAAPVYETPASTMPDTTPAYTQTSAQTNLASKQSDFDVSVPKGVAPGGEFEADIPGHGLVEVDVPKNAVAGETLQIDEPASTAPADASATAAAPAVAPPAEAPAAPQEAQAPAPAETQAPAPAPADQGAKMVPMTGGQMLAQLTSARGLSNVGAAGNRQSLLRTVGELKGVAKRLELEMKRSGVGSVQVHPSNVGDALKAARRAEQAATKLQGAPAPKM